MIKYIEDNEGGLSIYMPMEMCILRVAGQRIVRLRSIKREVTV